ncbi:hypothetical protein ABK040_008752 [Willaertia magna]
MPTMNPRTTTRFNFAANNLETIKEHIENQKQELNKFLCPISKQIMTDPVMINETGQTYDRQSIEKWLTSNSTCPLSGKKLINKTITPNYFLKSFINEIIVKYIKQMVECIKVWYLQENLNEICLEIVNECLVLDVDKNLQDELLILKSEIILQNKDEDLLFKEYTELINSIKDVNSKLLYLQKVESKLSKEYLLLKYYVTMLDLLIFTKNYNFLEEIFIKFVTLNDNINYQVINKVLNVVDDNYIINFLHILLDNTNYDRYQLLNIIFSIKTIYNIINFINFFKKLFKEINLTLLDKNNLQKLSILAENYNELKEEQKLIYLQLITITDDITYIEKIYNLNKEDKEIEKLLMNKYLEKEMLDSFLILYIKTNPTKLDNSILQLLFIQNKKLNKYENEISQLKEDLLNIKKEMKKTNQQQQKPIEHNSFSFNNTPPSTVFSFANNHTNQINPFASSQSQYQKGDFRYNL